MLDDPPSELASATVALLGVEPGGTLAYQCTGTLITPTHVVTPAHCLTGFEVTDIVAQVDPADDPGPTGELGGAEDELRVVECFGHPQALSLGDPVAGPQRCDRFQGRDKDEDFRSPADLAVLVLEEPGFDVSPRSLGPPQLCPELDFEGDGLIRGFGQTHPARRRAAAVISPGGVGSLRYEIEGAVRAGDSGDTIEERFRPEPPVLGYVVASGELFFGSGPGILLWDSSDRLAHGSHIEWLWREVLDAEGNCDLDVDGDTDPGACALPGTGAEPLDDRDGDGLPDVRDLCPDVNPLLDADGDGEPDGAFADGQHVDSDNDFVGDDCDECPGSCDFEDPDRDDLPSGCDLCPRHRLRPGTADDCGGQHCDDDGDGTGNLCDLCPEIEPEDPTEGHSDEDEDGHGDLCDNCPAPVTNPLQANCNLDAELAAGVVERGDMCDPTPCGETRLETVSDREFAGGRLVVTQTRSHVTVDARADLDAAERARAGARFCPCTIALSDDADTRRNCVERRPDNTGGCTMTTPADLREYRTASVSELQFWRLIDVDYDVEPSRTRESGLRTEVVADYARIPDERFFEDYAGEWDLFGDLARWEPLFPEDPDFPSGPAGLMWTRTAGPPTPDVFFGESFGDKGQLANHFWSGGARIDRFTARRPDPCISPFMPWVEPPQPICPSCAGSFPTPWVGIPIDIFRTFPPLCGGPRLLPPELLTGDGLALDAGPLFAPGSESALREQADAQWVAASEPEGWLPQDGPLYVAISPDGTTPLTLLQATADGLGVPGLQQPPIEPASIETGCEGRCRPGPRTEHLVVVSARRSSLWMGGGISAGGQLMRDLWTLDLRSGQWDPLQLPFRPRPARVLAAAYSPVDDALWVLDRLEERAEARGRGTGRNHGPSRARIRLLRIDAVGRTAQVVETWPRRSENRRFDLAVDPTGALYVAASREERGPHVVLRFEATTAGGIEAVAFRSGGGILAADEALRAGPEGISLIVRQPNAPPEVVGHRNAELLPAGRGVVRRCF